MSSPNNNPTQPAQQTYVPVGIYNGPIPKEGPKSIPVQANFATVNKYVIDFTLIYNQGFISELQAVWIDNSSNNAAVTLANLSSNQQIVVAAGRQGIYPVLSPNPPVFSATSAGTGNVQFQFLNVPITCLSWPTSASTFSFDGNGYLETDDIGLNTKLASIIANSGLVLQPAKYLNNSAGTAGLAVKAGAGTLFGVTVGEKGTSTTLTLYDNTSATAPIIATLDTTALGEYLNQAGGIAFNTGLFIVASTVTPANITIAYQ